MAIKNNKSRAPFPSYGVLVWKLLEIMIITIEGGMVEFHLEGLGGFCAKYSLRGCLISILNMVALGVLYIGIYDWDMHDIGALSRIMFNIRGAFQNI